MQKRKLPLLLLSLLITTFTAFGQTIVWSETFQNSCANDCLASGYSGPEGAWTVTNTGVNGADANTWYVSGAECGNAATVCGSACGATDPSLHIGSNATVFGDMGASFLNGGFGFFFPETDSRAESPTIDMTGNSTITINFNYIENGDASNDNATLWYFNGAVWAQIDVLAKTPLTCNPQGTWTAYSAILPASANNNPNIKIGFRWVNNDDGVGTDPSFAVDDITLTIPSVGVPPTADFSATATNICEGTCIDFTNLSTFVAGATFNWDFGNGSNSALQNPTGICYNNPGTYTVVLTVSDAGGTDVETKVNYITVVAASSAGADNTATLCNNGATLNLNTLLSGQDPGGTWAETTGTPSGQFNTGTGVFDGNGLTAGTYTFTYTVAGTAPCPNDVANFTITVNACSGPTAIISASNLTVCQGQSLIFNSASTSSNPIVDYNWSFGGAFPGTANSAGPHSVTFTGVGTFDVWLQITDDQGFIDDTTIQVVVTPCSTPTAAFSISDSDPCEGDCITFTNNSSSVSTPTYLWTFNGGLPASSTSANPGPVCYNAAGTYSVSLTVTNSFGTNTYSQNITVLSPPTITTAGDAVINLGDSTDITAIASDGVITWSWSPNNQGDVLDCTVSDCSQATVFPTITTTFTATTTTTEGCTATDIVIIAVNVPAGGYAIGVPNAFSPNDDGNNDMLFVDGLGITDMTFRVYNRYGQLVFETMDQNIGWNGTFNQEPLNPATFAWTLEFTLVNGQSDKLNGNVTLLK